MRLRHDPLARGVGGGEDQPGSILDGKEKSLALHYQIKVKGALDENWSDWFDGLTITHDADGNTMLDGAVRDQTALYGLIAKLRDLGLTLLAVERRSTVMETASAASSEALGTSATHRRPIGCHTHES